MDHVIIDAGTLEFNAEDLTATGLLIPFGVMARSNLGEFTFAPGDIVLDDDLTGMSLNVEHKRENVVGAFTKLWEQPEGVMASFRYRNTPAGRKAFEEGKSGKRKHLSAEVSDVRIQGQRALPGAVVFAGAQVERPAFEGATLLAAEDTPVPDPAPVLDTDPKNPTLQLDSVPETITVAPAEGDAVIFTPEATPAEDNPEGGSAVTTTLEAGAPTPAPVVVPTTLLANQPAQVVTPNAEDIDPFTIFASMHAIKNGMQGQTDDAETLLAALSDIKYNATGGLTTAASGVLQPAWVGKLWQGKRYVRRYIDLLTHLYGGIQLGGRKGFTLDQGTALVQHWAGNKTDVPSGTASTATKASSLEKYGYGADVAREWYDLEGGAEVIQAFFEGVIESYAKLTDLDALDDIFAAAAGASLARLVDPDVFPSVAGHDYPEAMGMVIQGIDLVEDANDTPSFAIINRAARSQIRYTPKDLVPEYVSFTVEPEGAGAADGKVRIVTAPDSAFVGIDPAEPAVIVGAKNAIEFREQGTTPIQIEALNIAKGGIDKAVIGYLETFVVRPESLVLIGTADA